MASFSQGKFPPHAGFAITLWTVCNSSSGFCLKLDKHLAMVLFFRKGIISYLEKSFPYDDVGRVKTGANCVGNNRLLIYGS